MAENVFDQALQQYPILKRAGVSAISSLGQGDGNMLEFWPPGEPGSDDRPRPSGLPANVPGVEIYSDKTRPIDVLGDVVSHHLVKADPKVSDYYQKFQTSLTDEQRSRLQEQYAHAQKNFAEKRPYPEWEAASGLPAYFRGYAFQQWPEEFNARAYTPGQRFMFDEMNNYLRSPDGINPPPMSIGEILSRRHR